MTKSMLIIIFVSNTSNQQITCLLQADESTKDYEFLVIRERVPFVNSVYYRPLTIGYFSSRVFKVIWAICPDKVMYSLATPFKMSRGSPATSSTLPSSATIKPV